MRSATTPTIRIDLMVGLQVDLEVSDHMQRLIGKSEQAHLRPAVLGQRVQEDVHGDIRGCDRNQDEVGNPEGLMNIHPGPLQRDVSHDKSREGSHGDSDGNGHDAPVPEEREDSHGKGADAEKDAMAEGDHPRESEGQVEAYGEETPDDDVFHQDIVGGQEGKNEENKGQDGISDPELDLGCFLKRVSSMWTMSLIGMPESEYSV